jgi:hypothetical protein
MRLCHRLLRWQPATTYVAGRRSATYGLGRVFETESTYYADPSPLEAKWHISELLELAINSVERLKAGLSAGYPVAWRPGRAT